MAHKLRLNATKDIWQDDFGTGIVNNVGFGVDDLSVILTNEAMIFPIQ